MHFHFDSPAVWKERFERVGLEVRRWRYYLSPAAAHAFHRSHYVSLPHLLSKKLTGRWVPFPALTDNDFWIRPALAFRGRARAYGRLLHRVRLRAAVRSSCKMRRLQEERRKNACGS